MTAARSLGSLAEAPRIMAKSVIVLDRDGVINQDRDDYVRNAEQWVPIPGSLEAIAALTRAGFRVVVVTNQSGLARGFFDIRGLNAMHRKLQESVARLGGRIEMVAFCPHHPSADCGCRKPRLGLLEQVEVRMGERLEGCMFVGDSSSDLAAARAAKMVPVLVKSGKGKRTLAKMEGGLDGVVVRERLEVLASELTGWRRDR